MENEVIQPTSDVVTTNTSPENNTGYVQEPVVDSSQSSVITAEQQTPPAPKTERELAYEEINRRQEENYYNKGASISSWIKNDYNYDATQAGTLWVAGKINDVNTQMSFLEATLNEDLYSEMDLQKYFFDTNLATARAYAKEKKHETAYGFYRAAEEKALAEGQLTGWYMPAEAGYMLSQWVLADENLKDPNISDVDKARAGSVRRAVSGWFAANNITERGIECLNSLYLKETIRHNQEMERLQDDANQIQKLSNAAQNAANSASYKIQEATFKFQLAEMERDMGYDLNKDSIIGHTGEDAQRFGYYKDQKDWIKNNMGKAFTLWGSDHVHGILGNEYQDAYLKYENNRMYDIYKKETTENGVIYGNSEAFTNTGRKTSDGKEVVYTVVDNEIVVGYFEDNVWIPITDKELEFSTGENINDYVKNIFGKDMNTEGINTVVVEGKTYTFGRDETADRKNSYTNMRKSGWKKIWYSNIYSPGTDEKKIDEAVEKSTTKEGARDTNGNIVRNLTFVPDKVEMRNENEYLVLSGEDENNKKHYYVVEDDGQIRKVHENDIHDVGTVKGDLKIGDYIDLHNDITSGDDNRERVGKASWQIGYDKENDISYMALPHSDNSVEYYTVRGNTATRGDKHEVLATGLSEKDIQRAGFTPLYRPIKEIVKKENNRNIMAGEDDGDIDTTITPVNTSVKTGDTTTRTVSKSENKKTSTEKVSTKDKSNEEQVLEDYDKYITAFAAGEVMAQVEKYDKEMLKQLGVVKV